MLSPIVVRTPVLVISCIACSAPAPHAPTPTRRVSGYVLDASGPVNGAEVGAVALERRACPCPTEDRNDWLPDCTCPAAIPTWRDALDSCMTPSPLAVAQSDERGRVSIAAVANTLHATAPSRERWIATPELHGPIAFELAPLRSPRIAIEGAEADMRAAIAFADGHCVRLRRDGDTWIPEHPITLDDTAVAIAANRDGFTVRQLTSSTDSEKLAIAPTRDAAGECTPNTTAHLDGPFQHATAVVDANGRFRFPRVLGFDAMITCVDAGGTRDTLEYVARTGDVDGVLVGYSSSDLCIPVRVVDPHGRPIAGAKVTSWMMSGNFGRGTGGGVTDRNGRSCAGEYSNEVQVEAPAALGGACAGEERKKIVSGTPPRRIDVTLRVRPLTRDTWSGRVVTPEGMPVAGARVSMRRAAPVDTPDCSGPVDIGAETRLDGTFVLANVPRGKLEIEVRHGWYLTRSFDTDTIARPRDLTIDRGATWTGRVLDPEGHVIDRCDVFVDKSDRSIERAPCTPDGFALGVLPPGETKATVHVRDHALGKLRMLHKTVTIAENEHHRADLQWPAGESITGVIIDDKGVPIPHALLDALPKGAVKLSDRFSLEEIQIEADDAGRFELRHLATGLWTLASDTRHPVEVAAGARDVLVTGIRR
jgi:hypothetical protein